MPGKEDVQHTITEQALSMLHSDSFSWALVCCRGDREEAQEVLQITYVKILEGKATFSGRSRLKTWLFSVIRNTALSLRRKRYLRSLLWARQSKNVSPEPPGPEQIVQNTQRREAILQTLSELSIRQREVIELVFYHDMSIEESAQTIGVSLGSARVHYQRGKKRLASLLSNKGVL